MYGVLQSLFVQQDAATVLASCLQLSFELPNELKAIREIRNWAIGHPSGRSDGSSASISRFTLAHDGFDMRVDLKGQESEFRPVELRPLCEQQTVILGELLSRAAAQLECH